MSFGNLKIVEAFGYDYAIRVSSVIFLLIMMSFALFGLYVYFKEDRLRYMWVHKVYTGMLFASFLIFISMIIGSVYAKSKDYK